MLHKNRIWAVIDVPALRPSLKPEASQPARLAHFLTQYTWTGCTAFRLEHLLFLNDATSADEAQEYAVVIEEDGQFFQIESITFGWMTEAKAVQTIERLITSQDTGWKALVSLILEASPRHHCHLCA